MLSSSIITKATQNYKKPTIPSVAPGMAGSAEANQTNAQPTTNNSANPAEGKTYYQPSSYDKKVGETISKVQQPVAVKTGDYIRPVKDKVPEYKTPANANDGNLALKDAVDTGEATDAQKAQYEKNVKNIFQQGTQNPETAKTDNDAQRVANNRTEGDVEQAKENLTWRQQLADDKKMQRYKRTLLAINAIGDTLRNLGNLYYTTRGAAPQAIANNTEKLWNQFETERKEKEAKEAAAEKIAREQANKDRDFELKKRSADEKSEEHGWKKEDRPIDRANKENTYLGNASDTRVKLATEGDKIKKSVAEKNAAEANATSAKAKANHAEEQQKLKTQGMKLTNQGHVLENNNKRLTATEKKQKIAKANTEKTTRYTVNGKAYDVPNNRVKDVNNRLLDYANQHMPPRDDDKSWSAQDKIAWAKRQKNSEVDRIMKSAVDDKDPYKL